MSRFASRLACIAAGLSLFLSAAPHLAVAQSADIGIHGSNTVGAKLMPALIDAYARSNGGVAAERPSAIQEEVTIELRGGGSNAAAIDLQRHGSSTSFKGIASGAAQIGMASRPAKDKEAAALQAVGIDDIRARGNEHVVALDGLAIIVSKNSALASLDLETVARLFSGQIRDWAQLGQGSGRVNVYARDDKSGTFDTFNSLVMKPAGAVLSPRAKRFESNELLAEEVAADPNGIGFTSLAYADTAKTLAIRLECGMDIFPTQFNVKAEEYPLGRRLFLYTNGTPEAPLARDLLDFSLSDAAQPVIGETGFVDQSIRSQGAAELFERQANAFAENLTRAELEGLKDFTLSQRSFERASTTFRFNFARATLDNKSLGDTGRVARWMNEPANKDRTIRLIGFADNIGGYEGNLNLALRRAEAVERAILVQMFGEDFDRSRISVETRSTLSPVACNTTPEGRAKNRRVELWVSK
ncbi:MAG: phosphate ABC transporter substrate-binding/OmpA family protein [Pseudomonadota bacterium]